MNENENDDIIINQLKEVIIKKLNVLINIIFNDDRSAWCSALNIINNENDSMKHYDQLVKILRFMQSFKNINEIPVSLIESFAQNFLLTHELNIQINKLILTNFNNNNNNYNI